jgi:hypothetical protein
LSIDIDVLPLRPELITWDELSRAWARRLGADVALIGISPVMRRLGSKAVVSPGEPLAPSSQTYFELAVPSTLALAVSPNTDGVDEAEYLTDYARNLTPVEIEPLVAGWAKIGWTLSLTSFGGRSPQEPTLLRALACSLADLTSGRVVLLHRDVFDLDIGVYTADQFAMARWVAGSDR